MAANAKSFGAEASPGKIFVGGLDKHTSLTTFTKHFDQYGETTDIVIMRDRVTQQPRGFGFVTYADPSVVDKVIELTHVINGKQVEIKRTIPKGSVQSEHKDIKTKKIFVGGLPAAVTDDGFKNFFSKYGNVVEHQIIRDHLTNRSRGFGFVVFDSEKVVDDMLVKGNMIDMLGQQVEIKKAEPKKPSNQPPPVPALGAAAPPVGVAPGSDPRARPFGDGLGVFGDSYNAFSGSGFGPTPPFRASGAIGSRFGGYGGYGGSEFGGPYGGFASSGLGGYRGDSSLGYSSRLGSYGGLGEGYGAGGLGAYGRGDDGYGFGPGLGGGIDSGSNASYSGAGGLFNGRTGYSGSSRYHPYSR